MTPSEILKEIKNLFVLSETKTTEDKTENHVEGFNLAQPTEPIPVLPNQSKGGIPTEPPTPQDAKTQAPKQDTQTDDFVTKQEFVTQISELKAMFNQIMDIVNPKVKQDVPKTLSSEKENKEVELAEQEADAIIPSPETSVDKTIKNLYSQKREMNVEDLVFNKLFSN